jgi:hypothetical protein
MADTALVLPFSTVDPTAMVQFGDRFMIFFADSRPVVLLPNLSDGRAKGYFAGIKRPLNVPTLADSSDDALFLPAETDIYVAYCFASSRRPGVHSRLSPVTRLLTGATAKKITVNGFNHPRDDAALGDIDQIWVAAQFGSQTGMKHLTPDFVIDVPDFDFAAASVVIDVTEDELAQGFDLSAADLYAEIPPALKFVERFGERLWMGGARREVTFNASTEVTVTKSGAGAYASFGSDMVVNGTFAAGTDWTASPALSWTIGAGVANIANDTGLFVNTGGVAPVAGRWYVVTFTLLNGTGTFSVRAYVGAGAVTPSTPFRTADGTYVELIRAGDDGFVGLGGVASGGSDSVDVDNVTCFEVDPDSIRALLTLSGDGGDRFNDSHLHMSAWIDGRYVGEIAEIVSGTEAWLDRDVPENIAVTTDFRLLGHDDRLYPTGYHGHAPGGIPSVFPESVNLTHAIVVSEALDEGQTLMGLKAAQDALHVMFSGSVLVLTGGEAVGKPDPSLTRLHGRVGAISSGSLTKDARGAAAWVGLEGPVTSGDTSLNTLADQLQFRDFWRQERGYVDASSLSGIVMAYSREKDAFILGNFTIGGVAHWALVTLGPQAGLWLFNGHAITSNILVYTDSDGRERILAGDASDGRVKRLLDPGKLTDLATGADTEAAYTCRWRGGWVGPTFQTEGQDSLTAKEAKVVGIVGPVTAVTGLTMTLEHWATDILQRLNAEVAAFGVDQKSYTLEYTDPVAGTGKRDFHGPFDIIDVTAIYHSFGLTWNSNAGQYSSGSILKALEVCRMMIFDEEQG